MSGFFTLWDVDSGNFVDEFEDSSTALRAAAELIELNRPVYPDALLLRWTGPDGNPHDIAIGPALVALASGVLKGQQSSSDNAFTRRPRRVAARHRRRHVIREIPAEPIAS